MKENNFWYKVLGVCEIESFELWSYSLFEAGVMAIEELEVSSEKQHFCFYTDSLTEAKRLRGLFPDLNFQIIEEEAKDWDQWWRDRTQPVSVSSKLWVRPRSEEHTSEPSHVRISYAVFCLKKKKKLKNFF